MDLSRISMTLSGQAFAIKPENDLRSQVSAIPSNPFVGLRPFNTNESLLFFGRREQTIELLQRLHRTRFLAVVGSSGGGKSSLIRAGLIPKLKAGFLVEERDRWLFAVMKPGEAPIQNLAASVIEAIVAEKGDAHVADLVEDMQTRGAQAILDRLVPVLKSGDSNFLLLADQFEELFRYGLRTKEAERRDAAADFVSIMLALAEQRELPVYVVLTMRSDFIGDCENFYGLPEAMNRSQYLVPRLSRQQRREAIEGPMMLFGGAVASRLLDHVLNDAGEESDQLPIMQHALMRTWEHWLKDRSGPVDLADYEAVGTIKEALSLDADKALEGLSGEELRVAEKLFQSLTDTDHRGRRIRRPARLSEIEAVAGASRETVIKIIRRFQSDGRTFLNMSEESAGGDALVDISHESLIRQWHRLREWVDKESKSRAVYTRIVDAALRHKEGLTSLWDNPDLQIALKWRAEEKPNRAWAARYNPEFDLAMNFLDKSRRRSRIRLGLWGLLAIILLASIIITAYQIQYAQVKGRELAEYRAAEAARDAEVARQMQEQERLEKEQAQEEVEDAKEDLQKTTDAILTGGPVPFVFKHPVVGEVDLLRHEDKHIEMDKDWMAKNIDFISVPELRRIGRPASPSVQFYIAGRPQLQAAFTELGQREGFLNIISSWNGAFRRPGADTTRFSAGLPQTAHNLGIAFDISFAAAPVADPKQPKGPAYGSDAKQYGDLTVKPRPPAVSPSDVISVFEKYGFKYVRGSGREAHHFELVRISRPARN